VKTFNDNAGRTWTIAVNVDSIKRVKALIGVDLMESVEGKLLERLTTEPILLCDVIYALCKPQADAAGVKDEDFGRAMAGDAIDLATTALLEELVDFFPARRRTLLANVLAKMTKLDGLATQAATDRLERIDLTKVMDDAIADLDRELAASAAGRPSGSLPESSASSPAR
jgi:hypothetical protein